MNPFVIGILLGSTAGGLSGFVLGKGVDGVSRGLQWATIGFCVLVAYKAVKS